MILRQERVLSLAESLNGEDTSSKALSISHSDDIGLYTAIAGELPILIRETSNFVKNPDKPAFFHASTFYTSPKTYLESLKAIVVDHRTVSASKIAEFLNKPMCRTRTATIPLSTMLFSCMRL